MSSCIVCAFTFRKVRIGMTGGQSIGSKKGFILGGCFGVESGEPGTFIETFDDTKDDGMADLK